VVVKFNPHLSDKSEVDDPAKFYANIAEQIDEHKLLTLALELYEAV
jgi:hypothetical protein